MLKNALITIRDAEFGIQSCNGGSNESIHIGKHLVPLVGTFMPHLQRLRLWRPDDFPWTSSKLIFKQNIIIEEKYFSYFTSEYYLSTFIKFNQIHLIKELFGSSIFLSIKD